MNSVTHPTDAPKSRQERQASGKALRDSVPRSAHADWKPSAVRADIVELLEESNRGRLQELIPLRFSRMLQSPLAFYRGTANIMAEDLVKLPTTHLRLQSCGDCHLQNFGWFASPERNLVFDVNDFDETRRAPWEWDVKRLVASVVLAARGLRASKPQQLELGEFVARTYREHLTEYESLAPLEMWYERLDAATLLNHASSTAGKKRSQQIVDAARLRTVDENQKLRRLSCLNLPRIVFGNFNAHVRTPRDDRFAHILVSEDFSYDRKILRILKASRQLAAFLSSRLIEDDGRHMTDIGIDRVTEHEQFDDRNKQAEEQRRRVADDM